MLRVLRDMVLSLIKLMSRLVGLAMVLPSSFNNHYLLERKKVCKGLQTMNLQFIRGGRNIGHNRPERGGY